MLRNVPVRFKWGSQTLPRTWGDGRGVLRRVPGGSQRRHRAYALFPILLPEFTRASPIGCARRVPAVTTCMRSAPQFWTVTGLRDRPAEQTARESFTFTRFLGWSHHPGSLGPTAARVSRETRAISPPPTGKLGFRHLWGQLWLPGPIAIQAVAAFPSPGSTGPLDAAQSRLPKQRQVMHLGRPY